MATILWMDDYAGRGTEKRMGFDALIFFIEQRGHKVVIVSSREQIEEALEKIKTYDFLILDIIMDPLTLSTQSGHHYGGIDALEDLSRKGIKIPTIILSVMAPRMIKEEAERRGLDLENMGIKEFRRKGSITPTELADNVEKNLPKKKRSAIGVPA